MPTKVETVTRRLRSRSVSRDELTPRTRSTSRGRSKSPGRSKRAIHERASTPTRDVSGRKSLPQMAQMSPTRQSMRLAEKTLGITLFDISVRKTMKTDGDSFAKQILIDDSVDSFANQKLVEKTADIKTELKPQFSKKEDKIDTREPELIVPKVESKLACSGGCFVVAAIVVSLTIVAMGGLLCPMKYCAFDAFPRHLRKINFYTSVESAVFVIGWLTLQFLLALFPVGKLQLGQPLLQNGKRIQYRCNAFFALLVNSLMIAALFYFKFPVYEWVSQRFLHIVICASVISLATGVGLYVRARRFPTDLLSCSGKFLSNFYLGRELNPRILKVDLKVFFLFNVGFISWAVLGLLTILEAYQKHLWTGNLLLVAGLQCVYLLDSLLFQFSMCTTSTILNEGLGFKVVFFALVWQPIVGTIHIHYLLLHPMTFASVLNIVSTLIFLLGYVIYRWSSYEKDLFSMFPYDSAVSGKHFIPSCTGRPFLCKSWWRLCRHPNYLGTLLMVTGWSLPCGLNCPLSFGIPVLTLLIFVFRIRLVESLCHQNHGVAWSRYTQTVTSRLVPWVY